MRRVRESGRAVLSKTIRPTRSVVRDAVRVGRRTLCARSANNETTPPPPTTTPTTATTPTTNVAAPVGKQRISAVCFRRGPLDCAGKSKRNQKTATATTGPPSVKTNQIRPSNPEIPTKRYRRLGKPETPNQGLPPDQKKTKKNNPPLDRSRRLPAHDEGDVTEERAVTNQKTQRFENKKKTNEIRAH